MSFLLVLYDRIKHFIRKSLHWRSVLIRHQHTVKSHLIIENDFIFPVNMLQYGVRFRCLMKALLQFGYAFTFFTYVESVFNSVQVILQKLTKLFKNFYYLLAIICTVFYKTYDPVTIAGNDCRIITLESVHSFLSCHL